MSADFFGSILTTGCSSDTDNRSRPDMIPKVNQEPAEAALYISKFAADLRRIAAGADLDFLAYLLGMVEEEANTEARKLRPPN